MPPINYGFEKLFLAFHNAIGSKETPQKRLASAITYNLIHLERENLPSDEAWENLRELVEASTRKAAKGDEGTIEATTSQMSDDEASEWLGKMLDIFSDVAEEYGKIHASEDYPPMTEIRVHSRKYDKGGTFRVELDTAGDGISAWTKDFHAAKDLEKWLLAIAPAETAKVKDFVTRTVNFGEAHVKMSCEERDFSEDCFEKLPPA